MAWRFAVFGILAGLLVTAALQLNARNLSQATEASSGSQTLTEIKIPEFVGRDRGTAGQVPADADPAPEQSTGGSVDDSSVAIGGPAVGADGRQPAESGGGVAVVGPERTPDRGPASESPVTPTVTTGTPEPVSQGDGHDPDPQGSDGEGQPLEDNTGDPAGSAAPSERPVESSPGADPQSNQPLLPSQVNRPRPIVTGVRQRAPIEIFVDPVNGRDENSGADEEQALGSLATAIGRLQPGHTLRLMSGTYGETMAPGAAHYLVTNGGTPGDWVRITAADGHRPVIVGSSLPALEVRADYVEVANLTLEGRGYTADNSWGVGLAARESHHVVFSGNSVSGFALAGINTIRASDISVLGNRVFGNAFYSPNQGSGISLWSSQNQDGDTGVNRIIGNLVYENENKVESGRWPGLRTDGNGIIVDEARLHGYQGSFLIANNVVVNNGGRAIHIWKSDNVDVVFNTTYHNAWSENLNGKAELSAGHSDNLRFINNLVWADIAHNIPAMNLDIDRQTGRPTAELYSAGNLLVSKRGSVGIGPDDLLTTVAPLLVAPGTAPDAMDLRPRWDSRAVDRALGIGPSLATDFLGGTRGDSPDIGAYEFSG